MIDHDLERRLIDCTELLKIWHKFHSFLVLAVKGGNSITHDKEAAFLKLKSRIAMLHDSFMESLKHDHAIGQHILSIVERSITLKHLNRLSMAEIKKIEIEWHESYLLLSETVASMEEQKEVLANVNPTKYKLKRLRLNFAVSVHNLLSSLYFKLILIIIGIPVLFIIVNQFWSFSNLKNYNATRDIYYKAVGLYRNINPGLPFERFEDIPRKDDQRPEDLEETSSMYQKRSAANLFTDAGISNALNASNVKFKEESYDIRNNPNKLSVLMFMFTGDEGTEKAENAVQKFQRWVNSLPSQRKTSINNYYSVFRKNNVFIVLASPMKSIRNSVKELEFGVF